MFSSHAGQESHVRFSESGFVQSVERGNPSCMSHAGAAMSSCGTDLMVLLQE